MTTLVCQCSCPDASSAARIAQTLVEENLAACVQQMPPMVSTYRWQGQLETSSEVLLLIKTTQARLPAVMARVSELHPYEVPELLATPVVGGLPAYLDWVHAQTQPE